MLAVQWVVYAVILQAHFKKIATSILISVLYACTWSSSSSIY